MIFSIGRVVVKIAGRDAGKTGVITEIFDDNYVMVAGQLRNRKCNIKHLELTGEEVKLPKQPDETAIATALQSINIPVEVKQKKAPKQNPSIRPRKMHIQKSTTPKKTQKSATKPSATKPKIKTPAQETTQ